MTINEQQPHYQTLGQFDPDAALRQGTAITHPEELIAAYNRISQLESVLGECRDYFEVRADAEYLTESPAPAGNPEMRMLCQIDEVLS